MNQVSIILFTTFFCILNSTYTQQLPSDSTKNDSTIIIPKIDRYKIFINHSTASTLFGRKDSVSIPTLSPSFKYISHNNFFCQASLYHTNTTSKIFDELDAKLGYRFYFKKWFDGSISYTKFMFNKDVSRLTSLVNHDINLYAGFDLYYIYTGISFDYTYGKKSLWIKNKITNKLNKITASLKDVNYTWMNYKQFYLPFFGKKNTFIITPEIDFVFGSQNNIQVYRFNVLLNQKAVSSPIYLKAIYYNLDFLFTKGEFSFNFSPYVTVPYHVSTTYNSSPYLVYYSSIIYTHKWEKKKSTQKN